MALYLRVALGVSGVPFGETVGVTVFPGGSATLLSRVNMGNVLAAEVERRDHRVVARMYVAAAEDVRSLVEEHGGSVGTGLESFAVDNVNATFADLASARAFVDDSRAVGSIRQFAEAAASRRLPNPNWHNPLVEVLVRPLLAAHT